MKRKLIVFAAALAACSLFAAVGHVTATAETDSFANEPLLTPAPGQETLQDEDASFEQGHYIVITEGSSVTSSNGHMMEGVEYVEPTPMPELRLKEEMPNETVEYFEAEDGSIWTVTSTVEWITPEKPSSETAAITENTGDYEEKILSYGHIYSHQVNPLVKRTVASVSSRYTVRYYKDNTVYLCDRTHTSTLLDDSYSIQLNYGKIVNTDGSVSYTSGDKFKLTKNGESHYTNLNFVVSPSTYSFD